MVSYRLNVCCRYCGRVIMRANRIENEQIERLRMHLRVVHTAIQIDLDTAGVLKHFDVKESDRKLPSDAD